MKSATHTSPATEATARGRESPVATTVGLSAPASSWTTLPSHSQATRRVWGGPWAPSIVISAPAPSAVRAMPQGPAHTAVRLVTCWAPTSMATTSPARCTVTRSRPGESSMSALGSAPTGMVTRAASVAGSRMLTLP